MTKKGTHWRYGIITGLAIVITLIILFTSGLEKANRPILIPHFLHLTGLILNANAFSKANNRRVRFADVFKSCFKAACIVSFLAMTCYLIKVIIHPDLIQASANFSGMAKIQKQMSSEDKQLLQYIMPVSLGFAYLVTGTIFCVIAAAIVKKKKEMKPAAEVI